MITEADIQNKVTEYCRKHNIVNIYHDRDEMLKHAGAQVSKIIGFFHFDHSYRDLVKDLYIHGLDYVGEIIDECNESSVYDESHVIPGINQFIECYFHDKLLHSYDLLLAEYNQDMKEGEYDV